MKIILIQGQIVHLVIDLEASLLLSLDYQILNDQIREILAQKLTVLTNQLNHGCKTKMTNKAQFMVQII